MPVTEVPLGTPLSRFGISRLCCGQGKDLPGWHPVLSESKAWGTFFVINMLIFIFFIVKILPEKRQLKSSDSSRKKGRLQSETAFIHCFYLIFLKNRRTNLILPSTFTQQWPPKPPRSHFLSMPGFPKQKTVYFTTNKKCYLYISSFCHGQSLLPSILSSTLLMGRRGWFGRASGGFRKPPSILFLGRVEDAGSRRVSVSVIEKGGVLRPSSRRHEVPRDAFLRRER